MRHIQINAQCYGKFGELFPAKKEPAELFLEGFVGCLLLDFFEFVLIEDVTITFAPTPEMEQLQYCAISIEADGDLLPLLSGMRNVESTELALESRISSAFMEIFEIVHMEQVTISASPAVLPIHLIEKE
ncbi:MAG: hypothetical protein ABI396_03380 [Ktedonobacteraceae bacterium]